ncbi:OX-2 membrane glycoprotein-like [Oryzias latipes]|uniref:OX-2 membrane glycoprotein-like n=1 Tax=Oryzias latipes TaxID=8090 RepID=UPI0000E9D601|nr:OX-2 membrane glycoprotein-like [Oryzias latipes]
MGKCSLSFILLFFVSKGETSVVQTQQTVTAAAGGEAHLSCRLTQPKDVLQITWQKIVSGVEENIGSYSELYGERVVSKFKGKILISSFGMQNSSIVVRNVSEEDGGCFLCLFNADPEGALKGRTCLQVYGKKMLELLPSGLDVEPGSVHGRGRLAVILIAVMVGTGVISALIFYMWRCHPQKRSFWGKK